MAPPLASRLWALELLHADDSLPLWIAAGFLLGVSLSIVWSRGEIERRAAILLSLLMLLGAEGLVRIAVRLGDQETRNELIQLAHRSYTEAMAYQPHPFLQFTGRPDVRLEGNEALSASSPYNELGFRGPVPEEHKPSDTVRVACLGGSTTARGYPRILEEVLDAELPAPLDAQVMNLGLGYYTSQHSAINFIINAIDYDLDYVVVHHAWNDLVLRDRQGIVRGDYLHGLKAFENPSIPDRLLIRGSVIYRWLKQRITGTPAHLGPYVLRSRAGPLTEAALGSLDELRPYQRNIETILDLALMRGITPVLTTQPHAMDVAAFERLVTIHIDQCNDIVREIAQQYGDRILFVDLDQLFTGVHEKYFRGLGHMRSGGMRAKARAIGDVILSDWRSRD